jgi:DNA polymerase I-like protein with 3'-5' exonuclease and polymerase domains
MGRKRTFFGLWGDNLFREAYSFLPQSTVADVLNLALIQFHNLNLAAEEMLQIHDAFVVQCKDGYVPEIVEGIRTAFDIPIYINGRILKIPVDIKAGKNWQDLEVIK